MGLVCIVAESVTRMPLETALKHTAGDFRTISTPLGHVTSAPSSRLTDNTYQPYFIDLAFEKYFHKQPDCTAIVYDILHSF